MIKVDLKDIIGFFVLSQEGKKKCYLDFRRWLFWLFLRCSVVFLIFLFIILISSWGRKSIINIFEFLISNKEITCICFQLIFIFLVLLFPIKKKFVCFKKQKKDIEENREDINNSIDDAEIMKKCGYEETDKEGWKEAQRCANEALNQYKTRWYLIWLAWLVLYVVLLLRTLYTIHADSWSTLILKYSFPFESFHSILFKILFNSPTEPLFNFFLNLFNNLSTLFFILCYLVLTEITTKDETSGIRETPNWMPWATILLVISILNGLFSFSLIKIEEFDYNYVFQLMAGVMAGISMALYIGRFDSKFIDAPTFFMASLYAYAIIQTFFTTYSGNSLLKLLVIIFAFLFKILLFLFMYWLFKSRRLLFYFIRVRRLHYDVDDEWGKFFKYLYKCDNETDKEALGNKTKDARESKS